MTNPTPQPASAEEWRAEQRADGWWTLLTNSTILAFGMDTATKDAILSDHAQAARTRKLEETLVTEIALLSRPGWPHEYQRGGIHQTPCRGCDMLQRLTSHRTAQEEA
jgi:hypothetical protein